uniref:Uncharacterized protein n=1 Tax=Solanum lycopersicum TaxID=4081 RepID=A0A3Q7ESN1_SOLLC
MPVLKPSRVLKRTQIDGLHTYFTGNYKKGNFLLLDDLVADITSSRGNFFLSLPETKVAKSAFICNWGKLDGYPNPRWLTNSLISFPPSLDRISPNLPYRVPARSLTGIRAFTITQPGRIGKSDDQSNNASYGQIVLHIEDCFSHPLNGDLEKSYLQIRRSYIDSCGTDTSYLHRASMTKMCEAN